MPEHKTAACPPLEELLRRLPGRKTGLLQLQEGQRGCSAALRDHPGAAVGNRGKERKIFMKRSTRNRLFAEKQPLIGLVMHKCRSFIEHARLIKSEGKQERHRDSGGQKAYGL